ncbi:MAG: sporulation protein [Polaromonas sp.]|nr:sporulation protein [Polaromonas sp.]
MQVTVKSWEYGMKKQRGGTLLGLVIGALVGLGIALTVAVYVTKVPVPFMNKSPSHTPDSDAAEARKNKDWNPNAPLAGKNPARAAPSASGELSPPAEPPTASNVPDPVLVPEEPRKPERVVKPPKTATAPATPSTPPAPAPAPTAAAKPAKPLSADPLGDLAKARSESPAFSSGASDPFNYFIQAGAYRTPEDAEQQRARLLLLGMQAKVTEREQAGRTVYRVRVGPFDKKDDADRIKDRLDNSSIETALVRVQR